MDRSNGNGGLVVGILIGIIIMLIVGIGLFATNTISFGSKTDENEQTSNNNNNSNQQSNITGNEEINIDELLGDYSFTEYNEPNQTWVYKLKIYNDNDKYYADINVDGFQTMVRLRTEVIKDDTGLKFSFDKVLDEHATGNYSTGDILFKLYKKGNYIYTKWEKMQPMLSNNKDDGVYFIPV